MSNDESSAPAVRSADQQPLPPVEAPSSAFVVQLFLIPLVIVGIIVGTWMLVGWLAHADADPYRLAEDIRRQGPGSWQKAYTLSNMLHSRQYEGLRRDRKLCGILIAALEEDLPRKVEDKKAIEYRAFLCRALGAFDVADPLPVLVRSAGTRDAQPVRVRVAAVQALAMLADRLGRKVLAERPEVVQTLIAITEEPAEGKEPQAVHELHAAAAYALGVIGGPAAKKRLVQLLDDAYANTRYNAATGLAWLGEPRALPVLLEMLDPNNPALLQGELTGSKTSPKLTRDQVRQSRQILVVSSAIGAVTRLCQHSEQVDRDAVRKALQKIVDSRLPTAVKLDAREALIVLRKAPRGS